MKYIGRVDYLHISENVEHFTGLITQEYKNGCDNVYIKCLWSKDNNTSRTINKVESTYWINFAKVMHNVVELAST